MCVWNVHDRHGDNGKKDPIQISTIPPTVVITLYFMHKYPTVLVCTCEVSIQVLVFSPFMQIQDPPTYS